MTTERAAMRCAQCSMMRARGVARRGLRWCLVALVALVAFGGGAIAPRSAQALAKVPASQAVQALVDGPLALPDLGQLVQALGAEASVQVRLLGARGIRRDLRSARAQDATQRAAFSASFTTTSTADPARAQTLAMGDNLLLTRLHPTDPSRMEYVYLWSGGALWGTQTAPLAADDARVASARAAATLKRLPFRSLPFRSLAQRHPRRAARDTDKRRRQRARVSASQRRRPSPRR